MANTDITTIWAQLEGGLDQIYNQHSRVQVPKYMGLYTGGLQLLHSAVPRRRERPQSGLPPPRGAQPNPQNTAGADFIGADLYERLRQFVTVHVTETAKELVGLHGEDLLEKYTVLWTRFQFSSTVVNGIFSYLNRHWIRREIDEGKTDVYEVYNLAVLVWNEVLFKELNGNITTALLRLIQQERNGEKITTKLLSCVIGSYLELGCNESRENANAPPGARPAEQSKNGVYKRFFETPFLSDTRDYYAAESASFVQQHTVTDYLKKVEQRLKEEHDRCTLYLDRSTLEPLTKTCHDVLIRQHLAIFQLEFEQLLLHERDEDLGRMFNLCEHVDGAFELLRTILEKHVEAKGRQAFERVANTAISDPKQYVNVILEVHARYSQLVNKTFRGDAGFVQAMDKALTSFVNNNRVTEISKSASKSPELLARCCDLLLRKSSRNPEDRELEDLLSQVIVVFKYVSDKDVFQKFYSKMLAKRLVSELSASDEGESIMITKLKQMCGFEYTSKLQRMFTDANLSKEITELFKKSPDGANSIDVSVMVLTTGVWPFTQATPFEIPPELSTSIEKFTTFYQNRHNGRRLTFLLGNSRGEVVSHAFTKRYTFVTTIAQMSILMLFNSGDEYTFDQFAEKLNMKKDLLALRPPGDRQGRAAEDRGRRPGVGERHPRAQRELLQVVVKSDARRENDEVQKSIEDDRRMVVQAAIVRTMKARKTLKHSQLVAEVLAQLTPRFQPKIPLVKKSIELLIEKEYLKRNTDDLESLDYIA
ncbi:hypothetical protein M3Y99_00073600 [Aphelenchoides fujianensis]|nr:hypothetical protein M3Y99_00073600 [Aphelenchoides fujianensis]